MGGNRIKGITIEIGGDTTKLSKAVTALNKPVQSTKSQLKDIEHLLKMDPTNVNLLAQRQRLLADAVQETKKKLDTLKEAEKQVQEQMAEGKVSQDQYDALKREIIDTEEQLKKLEKTASTSNETLGMISGIGTKLQTAGDKISGVGKAVMPASAGVLGLGTAAVKATSDFDAAMSQVAAVSGATGDEFTALREKAREMGAETKFSASEAAEAMNYMAMAGWKKDDMLSGIEGIMDLAAASGEGLGSTSDIVTDALTAFGLAAQDSAHFADILAAASSNANTNVSMMGETFKYCAPIAGAMGFSAEDTAEAIGLMANSGIKASQAGTALRSIMSNLGGALTVDDDHIIETVNADGSMRELSDILGDLRIAFSGLSESEKASTAEAMFGKTAMSGFLALMNAAPEDIDKLSNAIDNCDGSAKKMAQVMQDNLAGQTTILMSQLQELAISFGDLLMPMIRKVVDWVKSFVDKLNGMDEGSRKTILVIGGIVAAFGPFFLILGKIVSSVGGVMRAFVKVVGFLSRFGGALGSVIGWIGELASFIGSTLSSAFGLIMKAGGWMVGKLGACISSLGSAFSSVFSFIVANPVVLLIAAILGLVALIATKGEEIKALLQAADDFLQGVFAKDWSEIFGPVLGETINAFFANLKNVWDSVKQIFDGIIVFIQGVFTLNWEQAWNGIVALFSGVFSGLEALAAAPINAIIGLVNSAIGGINSLIDGINKIPGVDLGQIGTIPMLANGGIVSSGSAIVGEAGPELLTVSGGRAVVQPLPVNTGKIEGLLGAMAGKMGAGSSNPAPVIVRMELDGHTIGEAMLDYSRRRDIIYGD